MLSMKQYLRPCEAQAIERYKEKFDLIEDGTHVINFDVEQCQPDGWYMPVRESKANRTKYCADEQGELIEDFEVDISESDGMKCSECRV